jgi:hypothetical protein
MDRSMRNTALESALRMRRNWYPYTVKCNKMYRKMKSMPKWTARLREWDRMTDRVDRFISSNELNQRSRSIDLICKMIWSMRLGQAVMWNVECGMGGNARIPECVSDCHSIQRSSDLTVWYPDSRFLPTCPVVLHAQPETHLNNK